jgi:hypothetical protein
MSGGGKETDAVRITSLRVMSVGVLLLLAGALLNDLAALRHLAFATECFGCAAFLIGGIGLLSG